MLYSRSNMADIKCWPEIKYFHCRLRWFIYFPYTSQIIIPTRMLLHMIMSSFPINSASNGLTNTKRRWGSGIEDKMICFCTFSLNIQNLFIVHQPMITWLQREVDIQTKQMIYRMTVAISDGYYKNANLSTTFWKENSIFEYHIESIDQFLGSINVLLLKCGWFT